MTTEKKQNTPDVPSIGSPEAPKNASATFNPIELLSEEQRKAIGKRFNKTWLTPRMQVVSEVQAKHSLDFFSAAFTVAMLEDATNLVTSAKVAKVADTMYNLSSELFGTEVNKDAALLQIETAFDNLDAIQQPQAGKRFRQLVLKNYTSKMGVRVLEMVTEKLAVPESAWV